MSTEITTDLTSISDSLQEELNSYQYISANQVTVSSLREIYAKNIISLFDETRIQQILDTDLNKPIFQEYQINGDDEPTAAILNSIPLDASVDIASIDNSIINTTENYTNLISNTISRINAVKTKILEQKQRIIDINFIRNSYDGLNTVIPITSNNLTGAFSYDATNTHLISGYSPSTNKIDITVTKVEGNGYAGNKYVLLSDGTLAADSAETDSLSYITDASEITTFEYSRLSTLGQNTNLQLTDINKDNSPVTCTIYVSSKKVFNCLKITTPSSGLRVKDILISSDEGKQYHSAFTKEIKIDDSEYANFDYIPGCNMICFPKTNYAKIILTSDRYYNSEKLAAYMSRIIDKDSAPKEILTELKDVKRKVIVINDLTAYYNTYTSDSKSQTTQLIDTNKTFNTIAVFSNEYIPEYFTQDKTYIQYTLVVNGIEYSIVPINSNKTGTKIISCADYHYENENVKYITSPIKSAQLIINIQANGNDGTPFLGNLKICLG